MLMSPAGIKRSTQVIWKNTSTRTENLHRDTSIQRKKQSITEVVRRPTDAGMRTIDTSERVSNVLRSLFPLPFDHLPNALLRFLNFEKIGRKRLTKCFWMRTQSMTSVTSRFSCESIFPNIMLLYNDGNTFWRNTTCWRILASRAEYLRNELDTNCIASTRMRTASRQSKGWNPLRGSSRVLIPDVHRCRSQRTSPDFDSIFKSSVRITNQTKPAKRASSGNKLESHELSPTSHGTYTHTSCIWFDKHINEHTNIHPSGHAYNHLLRGIRVLSGAISKYKYHKMRGNHLCYRSDWT